MIDRTAIVRLNELHDDDLVLGVVHNELPIAFPIRYLALYEVIDHVHGDLPLAPTW